MVGSPRARSELCPGPSAYLGRQRDAVENNAADSLYRLPEQAHGDGHCPNALADDVDAPARAYVPAQLGDGSRMIEQGDVIKGVTMAGKVVGETAAAAIIDRPHIAVPLVEQALNQVLV